jgi:hypothetical protein
MNYFQKLLDPDSKESSGRFAFLLTVILSNIMWPVWIIACIYARSLVDIPSGVVGAYIGVNGTAFVGKGFQSYAEHSSSTRIVTAKSTMEVD